MLGVTVVAKGTAVGVGGGTQAVTQTLPVTASAARGLCTNTNNALAFFFKLK
jgi:hypothetical protein